MLWPLQAGQPRLQGILQLAVGPLNHIIALGMIGCRCDVVYVQSLTYGRPHCRRELPAPCRS
jgi:hypothetical protein